MKKYIIILIFLSKVIFSGTIIIQYGDDSVVDFNLARGYCYGDDDRVGIQYFSSNGRWERYYYKFPIDIMLTEALADSVFFKVYKTPGGDSESGNTVTLSVCRLTEDISSRFELYYGPIYGNDTIYYTPTFDIEHSVNSAEIPIDFEGWISFNITEIVNNWIFGGINNYGIVIKLANEKSPTHQTISLQTSSTIYASIRPKLEIYADFLPDTIITSSLTTSIENETLSKEYIENFEVEQNYPNPFNPTTTISYHIPEQVRNDNVILKVFDVLGRLVKVLVNENQKPGNYSVEFDGGNLPSGIYFYTLTAGEFSFTNKMLLMK